MQSHFHLSHDLVLLFDKWRGKTLADHLFFAATVFAVAVVYQFLRAYLKYQRCLQARKSGRYNLTALAASLLYQINFIVGYGLMLIAMIQSVILFTAISLGAGVGYFIAQPAYGLISDHAGNDIYYVKQTEAEKLDELETERLDTSLCPPHQFTYV